MISVSRLNSKEFFVNQDLIEFIEETPDTVITLTTGKKIIVEESAQAVIDKIIAFKRQIAEGISLLIDNKKEELHQDEAENKN